MGPRLSRRTPRPASSPFRCPRPIWTPCPPLAGAEIKSRYGRPDFLAHSTFIPNDPDYNNATLVYGPQQINAPAAWDTTLGDPNLILAVLDTGVDLTHPEFAGRIVPGYDFANNDSRPHRRQRPRHPCGRHRRRGHQQRHGHGGHGRAGQDHAHQGAQRQQRGLDERCGRRHHLCRGQRGTG